MPRPEGAACRTRLAPLTGAIRTGPLSWPVASSGLVRATCVLSTPAEAALSSAPAGRTAPFGTTAAIPVTDVARQSTWPCPVPTQDFPFRYFSRILAASAEVNGVTDIVSPATANPKCRVGPRAYEVLRRRGQIPGRHSRPVTGPRTHKHGALRDAGRPAMSPRIAAPGPTCSQGVHASSSATGGTEERGSRRCLQTVQAWPLMPSTDTGVSLAGGAPWVRCA